MLFFIGRPDGAREILLLNMRYLLQIIVYTYCKRLFQQSQSDNGGCSGTAAERSSLLYGFIKRKRYISSRPP
jgi:hypothetical protein